LIGRWQRNQEQLFRRATIKTFQDSVDLGTAKNHHVRYPDPSHEADGCPE
jgi:hypothetical protein